MDSPTIEELLVEYDRALAYTDSLWHDLSEEELHWRPHEESSAIGWHLGHQAAVAHFMVRNLTAAEPSIDAELDALMDSATPEPDRGALPERLDAEVQQQHRIGWLAVGRRAAPFDQDGLALQRLPMHDRGGPRQHRPGCLFKELLVGLHFAVPPISAFPLVEGYYLLPPAEHAMTKARNQFLTWLKEEFGTHW